jgi:orotate phosphoribosyltransferase-like protein
MQVNWDNMSYGMLQVYFKEGMGDRREVESVGAVGRNFGIQGGNVLVQINDTHLSANITKAAFDNLRTKTAKPMRCVFLRKRGDDDSRSVTVETSMVEADFSKNGLGVSGAIMLLAFIPKCT